MPARWSQAGWRASAKGVAGYVTPKVAVGAIVGNERGELLLIQRGDSGVWLYPTGWADVGYSAAEVVVKEVAEETGIEVEPVRLIAVLDGLATGGSRPALLLPGVPLPGRGRRAASPSARSPRRRLVRRGRPAGAAGRRRPLAAPGLQRHPGRVIRRGVRLSAPLDLAELNGLPAGPGPGSRAGWPNRAVRPGRLGPGEARARRPRSLVIRSAVERVDAAALTAFLAGLGADAPFAPALDGRRGCRAMGSILSLSSLSSPLALDYLERLARPIPALTAQIGVQIVTRAYLAQLVIERDPAAFGASEVPCSAPCRRCGGDRRPRIC